jgi:D-alanyl-D-alanine dipeptidase
MRLLYIKQFWRQGLIFVFVICFGIYTVSHSWAEEVGTVQSSLERLAGDNQYVEIQNGSGLLIRLKYATTDNFTGSNLYGEFKKCYLQRLAGQKLAKAVSTLREEKPEWKIVVFDALRPRSVQYILWRKVKGTTLQRYVADPEKGSIHNYGLAVDVGLMNENGDLLDMGTPFDGFSRLSEPRFEREYLKSGKLSLEQLKNRLLLREIMTKAGFIQLPVEWWHYDAIPLSEIKGKMPIVE